MGIVSKCIRALLIYSISLFWGSYVILGFIYRCLTKGYSNVVYWTDRSKSPGPLHYKAWDEDSRDCPGKDMKQWQHAYVTVVETGLRMHYVYSGKLPENIAISHIDRETVVIPDSEETSEARPKLLLCAHGYPENWFSWRHTLRYFDNPPTELTNYFVVAIDMRGYGDSDKPKGIKSYHINNLASDIRGVAEALGYKKFILAGHDWGGAVAWHVAQVYSNCVEKLIILNCAAPNITRNSFLQSLKQLLMSWYIFFYQTPIIPEIALKLKDFKVLEAAFNGKFAGIANNKNRLTKEELEVYKYSMRNSASCAINYYRAALSPFAQPGPKLKYPSVKQPLSSTRVLLIWGTEDKFQSKQLAVESAKQLNQENGSKLVFVEGASHWVEQDAPEEVIKHIADFLLSK